MEDSVSKNIPDYSFSRSSATWAMIFSKFPSKIFMEELNIRLAG